MTKSGDVVVPGNVDGGGADGGQGSGGYAIAGSDGMTVTSATAHDHYGNETIAAHSQAPPEAYLLIPLLSIGTALSVFLLLALAINRSMRRRNAFIIHHLLLNVVRMGQCVPYIEGYFNLPLPKGSSSPYNCDKMASIYIVLNTATCLDFIAMACTDLFSSHDSDTNGQKSCTGGEDARSGRRRSSSDSSHAIRETVVYQTMDCNTNTRPDVRTDANFKQVRLGGSSKSYTISGGASSAKGLGATAQLVQVVVAKSSTPHENQVSICCCAISVLIIYVTSTIVHLGPTIIAGNFVFHPEIGWCMVGYGTVTSVVAHIVWICVTTMALLVFFAFSFQLKRRINKKRQKVRANLMTLQLNQKNSGSGQASSEATAAVPLLQHETGQMRRTDRQFKLQLCRIRVQYAMAIVYAATWYPLVVTALLDPDYRIPHHLYRLFTFFQWLDPVFDPFVILLLDKAIHEHAQVMMSSAVDYLRCVGRVKWHHRWQRGHGRGRPNCDSFELTENTAVAANLSAGAGGAHSCVGEGGLTSTCSDMGQLRTESAHSHVVHELQNKIGSRLHKEGDFKAKLTSLTGTDVPVGRRDSLLTQVLVNRHTGRELGIRSRNEPQCNGGVRTGAAETDRRQHRHNYPAPIDEQDSVADDLEVVEVPIQHEYVVDAGIDYGPGAGLGVFYAAVTSSEDGTFDSLDEPDRLQRPPQLQRQQLHQHMASDYDPWMLQDEPTEV